MTSTMGFCTHQQVVSRRRADSGRRPSIAWERTLVASLAVLLGTAGAAHAASDVVVTTTGDRLVGEIKKVEKDVLTFETAYSDSDFKLKWDKIASIQSDRQFLVETFDGRVDGILVWPPRGDKGFGYDPMFVPVGHEITFGEMEPAEKHGMSHRAEAFRKLVEALAT